MLKRQNTDSSSSRANNPKELAPITAVIIGCIIGLLLSWMIYYYIPKPAFIDRFLVWWFSDHHTPNTILPPPVDEGNQEQSPTTNLSNENINNHGGGDDDDRIHNLPIVNNNNNNNNNTNNDIELTDFGTSTATPLPNTTTIIR